MKIRNDFITNSSSSSFIVEKKMNIDEVREKLKLIIEFYNKIFDNDRNFYDMFDGPYIIDKKYMDLMSNDISFSDNEIGKIIVESSSDNSIPFCLHELIEDLFDTRLFRLS